MVFDEKAQFMYACLYILHLITSTIEVKVVMWSKSISNIVSLFWAGVQISPATVRSLQAWV